VTIAFDPDKSKKVTKCDKIVFIQVVQKICDGTPVLPGDYNSNWKYKDDDCLKDGDCRGTRVDYLQGEKTPYYNDPQGTGTSPYGTVGGKNGGSVKATMGDAPSVGGGDKGMYDKDTNPGGWKSVESRFETFAYCAKGPDCGKWYEGATWVHTKTYDKSGPGTSKIAGHPSEPSDCFKKAFEKWNQRYTFKPCP
jgi:hypothetical protein